MTAAPNSFDDPLKPSGSAADSAQGDALDTDLEAAELAAAMSGPEVTWGQVWHAPALLMGLGLLALGIYLALPRHEPPDLEAGLSQVQASVTAGELERAREQIDLIRDDPYFQQLPESASIHGRLAKLRGDWRFVSMRSQTHVDLNTDASQQNHRMVVENYAQAKNLGFVLPTDSVRRYAESLARLNRADEAVDLVDSLPRNRAQDRAEVIRTLIGVQQQQPRTQATHERIGSLITRFEEELKLLDPSPWRLDQEVWATDLKISRLLDPEINQPETAITLLNPALIKLTSRVPDPQRPVALAPLYVLMGQAQLMLNDYDQAEETFRLAQTLLPETDELNAEVLIGQGRVAMGKGGATDPVLREEAEGFFSEAVRRYPTSEARPEAMIRLANAMAWATGGARMPEAIATFDQVANELVERRPTWDPNRPLLTRLAQQHALRSNQLDRYLDSLALLKIIQKLGDDPPDPDVVHAFAATYEQLGQRALLRAQAADPANLKPGEDPTTQAWQAANREAAGYFLEAGEAYAQYALAVYEAENEDELHGDALWKAAENFDRAQAWPLAIRTYTQFVEKRREDGRRVRAQLQLGRALMADRQYDAAIERLKGLIQRYPQAPAVTEAYVPLARCLAARERGGSGTTLAGRCHRSPHDHPRQPCLPRCVDRPGQPLPPPRARRPRGSEYGHRTSDRSRRTLQQHRAKPVAALHAWRQPAPQR